MSGVALAIGTVASAAVGAYGAHQQAKAANKSKTTTTNQTTTQTPFLYDAYGNDLGQILAQQRGIAARGAPQVGPNGQIYYAAPPVAGAPGANGEGFAGVSQSGTTRRSAPAPRQSQWSAFLASGGDKSDTAAWKAYQSSHPAGSSAPASPGGGTDPGSGPRPTGPMTAPQIFDAVARRGLEAGNTETIGQGRAALGNILGAAGGGGPESTGFEGYNPILDRLAGTLGKDVDQRTARDLLLKYLDPDSFRGGVGGGLGGPGGRGGGASGARSGIFNPANYGSGASGGHGSTTVGGVPVPDAAGSGLFGTEIRKVFEDAGDQESIQTLIDQMNADEEKAMQREMAQLDAASIGGGRFGGDMWKGMSADARRAAMDAMLKNSAGVRLTDAEARRQARLAALGLENTRDLGSLQAQTQLDVAGINAGAAGAGAAQSAELARRAQDLSALGMLFNDEQFSTGQLGDVGAQLSNDRLQSLGLIPGLEGVGLQGLGIANQAGGGLVDLQQIAAQDAASRRSAGLARADMNQRLGMFNAGQAQQSTNDYLATLLRIGGLGGTSTTQGQNVVPGAGISPMGAAAQGALGGALAGYGTFAAYR